MITLKTLPQATEQEVFDQIAVHLLTQNRKSSDRHQCMYKSKDGLKCAAGCLISDEEYMEFFERKEWRSLANDTYVPSNHIGLIANLQVIHDSYEECEWKNRLIDIARIKGLNTTAIERF